MDYSSKDSIRKQSYIEKEEELAKEGGEPVYHEISKEDEDEDEESEGKKSSY